MAHRMNTASQNRDTIVRRWLKLLVGERPSTPRHVDPALISFARLGLLAYYH